MVKYLLKKGNCPWNKNKKGWTNKGSFKEGHPYFSHQIVLEDLRPDYAKNRKEKRHLLGISKKYISAPRGSGKGICYTKEYKKLQRQKRKALVKGGGNLSIKTIQQVYEDNIKQYGTLTCYLCLNPIEFKKDHLEHKIPLSRGGTNEYNNLGIACAKCNCKKHTKTEIEYRKEF